jgi:hypothetical protein
VALPRKGIRMQNNSHPPSTASGIGNGNSDALQRVQWSRWFRCQSSFGLLLVPGQPGIYALAEEVLAPDDTDASGHKRMLAVFDFTEADDLSVALSRLFSPGSAVRERLTAGGCYLRYAVVPEAKQRLAICRALQSWLSSAAGAASGILQPTRPQDASTAGARSPARPQQPLPSGF